MEIFNNRLYALYLSTYVYISLFSVFLFLLLDFLIIKNYFVKVVSSNNVNRKDD